ncbi:MAG: hypothetical protein JRG71_06585 [Deltaproteobacteria bacterium]|nr:hypothetical protein [Deltaproteobacteria bacterium]
MSVEKNGHEAWENRCQRCGQCCYEKIEYRGKYYLTDIPCKYLNLKTKLCQIYPDRCQLKDGCVALTPEIIAMGVLPQQCAYVELIKSYTAPQSWESLPANILKTLKLAQG